LPAAGKERTGWLTEGHIVVDVNVGCIIDTNVLDADPAVSIVIGIRADVTVRSVMVVVIGCLVQMEGRGAATTGMVARSGCRCAAEHQQHECQDRTDSSHCATS
jgi:hypothetical protein